MSLHILNAKSSRGTETQVAHTDLNDEASDQMQISDSLFPMSQQDWDSMMSEFGVGLADWDAAFAANTI